MRALVFANGEPPSPSLAKELVVGADIVVAADGGAEKALACGIHPDSVVGDLDSVTPRVRAALPATAFHKLADPDRSDMEKVIDYCLELGADAIDIVGAGGGRADHALANLSVLTRYRGQARIRLVDEQFSISVVDGEETIEALPGTVISLVALGECRGVTTRGLRWELDDMPLSFGTQGVHNEISTSPATISVRQGELLLFKGRWIEKHR